MACGESERQYRTAMRVVHWFRNDLRLSDNTALTAAAARGTELVPLFVFDDRLLASPYASRARLRFLLDCVQRLATDLERRGCPLLVRRGDPVDVVARVVAETKADLLTLNRDYSPYAVRRDTRVRAAARAAGARVEDHKDRVVFESGELRTQAGSGFVVYTPFRNAWLTRYRRDPVEPMRTPALPKRVDGVASAPWPSDRALGVDGGGAAPTVGGEAAARRRLSQFLDGPVSDYARNRDRPGVDGTSRLSAYLRFGAVSARRCIHEALGVAAVERRAAAGVHKWIDELIWREFYIGLLADHPQILRGAFRSEFDGVEWESPGSAFDAWCEGRTGYPIVDAAMRQLRAVGWMHNRARMIAASFLTKDLLIDWRLGEREFMRHLIDGDPAANNGGWQWSASTGTDAQPYFRIFNPVAQGEKFDPDGTYVRRYVPELRDLPDRFVHRPWEASPPPPAYPPRIVDHAERRIMAVARYESARQQAAPSRRRSNARGNGGRRNPR